MSGMAISSALLPTASATLAVGATRAVGASPAKRDSPEKVHDAAQQFEALLIGQILHSARESGAGWFSDGEDPSGSVATDYGEQQFAAVLAKQGGLGLADMIAKGLERKATAE